jgi:uncharacterized protein YjbI with pentapeptide repeats
MNLITLSLLISTITLFGFKEEDLQKFTETGSCRGCDLSSATLTTIINTIKKQNSKKRIDLEGANLREADCSNADLSHARLRDADCRGANFENANLRKSNMEGAKAQYGKFSHVNFTDAFLGFTKFNNAYLKGANFTNAYCGFTKFNHAFILNTVFNSTNLGCAEFKSAFSSEHQNWQNYAGIVNWVKIWKNEYKEKKSIYLESHPYKQWNDYTLHPLIYSLREFTQPRKKKFAKLSIEKIQEKSKE